MHYKEDGEWVDYDNTLRAVTSLDGGGVSCYRVDNGESSRVFAENAQVLLQKGDYALAFAPKADLSLDQPIIGDDTVVPMQSATVLDIGNEVDERDDAIETIQHE